ncbi:PP2C family protein-serine/threonine phosphatase [Cellulomonas sp. Root137]|uniref:PP2C family protein-serine/threonine phosphatase n=1 Tax=Cellulomonas sp. Root137 TaxID=1736459 RepID=UPI0006F648E2|nr:SpoIIE family protein phosphatase [Cellulomonas sp. Root137]KQY44712.1 serine/threonine protein phosphatase [Cellulomonas sp. Root137]KRD41711.1 serine/threonine protein phosphatase [Cellulomonas sp. Root930]
MSDARTAADDTRRATAVAPAPIRLLLVEDDEGDAILVREHLADAGLDVALSWVRTLDQAIDNLHVDLVLLDLGLPDAMGIGALERLLAAGAPAVVVLTGLAGSDIGLQAVAAGAQDYLVKGEVDGELLGRSVRYAIQRRRLEDTDRALYRSLVRAEEVNRLERALLPTPSVVDQRLEVRVGYRAGRDGVLGGDFYDVVERSDGSVLALVGDVCGHGPDEAALGATLRTAWRTLVLAEIPTVEIFGLLERVLISERARPEIFTTVSMLDVAADRSTVDLYLAGHPVPLLLGAPSTLLPTHGRGRALGIPVSGGWEPVRLELGPSWRILLYTDGVLEATIGDGSDRLGKTGLLRVVDVAVAAQGDLVERVLHDVRQLHGGDLVDDAAVVVLGWRA